MSKLIWVIPDSGGLPSGGHLYNSEMRLALDAWAITSEQIGWKTYKARAAAREPGLYLLDTLFFSHFSAETLPQAPGFEKWLLVHHLESLFPPPGWRADDYFEQYERPVLEHFDGFVSTGELIVQYFHAKGITRPIISAFPAPAIAPQPRQQITGPLQALIVGNLIERKGILPFLQEFGEMTDDSGPFTLSIIGSEALEPAYAEACRSYVRQHPVLSASVQFTGPLNREQVSDCYARHELLVSPSRMETFGMALQEALACGLVLLATAPGLPPWEPSSLAAEFCRYTRQPELLRSREALPPIRYTWAQAALYLGDSLGLSITSRPEEATPKEEAFSSEWLDTRYPFDEKARKNKAEQAFLEYIQGKESVYLTDAGSGNGANFRYLMPLISASQVWTLVDGDRHLLDVARTHACEAAEAQGFEVAHAGEPLHLVRGAQHIYLHTVKASLLDLAASTELRQTDVVLANAVFDLFSEAQITHFLRQIVEAEVAFYPSINYERMEIGENSPTEQHLTDLYESHMQRPQAFGRAMGKDVGHFMAKYLQKNAFQLTEAESIWHIGPNDRLMMGFLLGFMSEALSELPLAPLHFCQVQQDIRQLRHQMEQGALRMEVRHRDIFAAPGK